MWGTTSIGYNAAKGEQAPWRRCAKDTWALMFDPGWHRSWLTAASSLIDDPTEVFSAALWCTWAGSDQPAKADPDAAIIRQPEMHPLLSSTIQYINEPADRCTRLLRDILRRDRRRKQRAEVPDDPRSAVAFVDVMAMPADATPEMRID